MGKANFTPVGKSPSLPRKMRTENQLLQNQTLFLNHNLSKLYKVVIRLLTTSRLRPSASPPSYQPGRRGGGGTSSDCCQHKWSICSLVVEPPNPHPQPHHQGAAGGTSSPEGLSTQTFPVGTHWSSGAFSWAKSLVCSVRGCHSCQRFCAFRPR